MTTQTLAGIRVLDLTGYVAGPYAGALLGDLGADVIKVEGPDGDTMRHYPSTLPGESRYYLGVNRNKRGIAIDLKKPEGLALLRRMIGAADVLMHNFRPSAAGRLGLGMQTLRSQHRRLVACSLTGFGTTGPKADFPGFDQVLQSLSGIAHAQGAARGEPQIVLGSAVDFYAAALLAMAISAALFSRERTGQGSAIDASLLRSALAMQAGRMVWAEHEGREAGRDLRPGRLAGIHPTREGHLYLQAQTPKFWTALCELTGLHELAVDPRYDTMKKRQQHEEALVAQLRAALMARTALEWEAHFGDRVPCTAVRSIEDMFDDPQVQAQGLVALHTHPHLGTYRAMRGPVGIEDGRPPRPERRAPSLGEHSDEVLIELGLKGHEIAALRQSGTIR